MAAPSFLEAGTGQTDAGGAWALTTGLSVADGNVIIFQLLQDGTTNGAVVMDGVNPALANLAGTTSALTLIPGPNADSSWPIGSAATGRQFLWIGRAAGGSTNAGISGTNSTSEDLYLRCYEFTNVSTGTTLATVIENGTAGNANNGAATSTTCSDTAVTTLGADRLACNFVGLSDDLMGLAVFTGMTGGTWGNFQIYEEASGTDATVAAEFATMATAGTIDGGSDTITSIGWGVVGFALIGTTVAGPTEYFGASTQALTMGFTTQGTVTAQPASDPTSWINDRRIRRRSLQRM